MIDEIKLREKLKWLIRPFKNSGGVPADLTDQIVETVKECEVQEAKKKKRRLFKS